MFGANTSFFIVFLTFTWVRSFGKLKIMNLRRICRRKGTKIFIRRGVQCILLMISAVIILVPNCSSSRDCTAVLRVRKCVWRQRTENYFRLRKTRKKMKGQEKVLNTLRKIRDRKIEPSKRVSYSRDGKGRRGKWNGEDKVRRSERERRFFNLIFC